jgi:site-specific recombinase XerD
VNCIECGEHRKIHSNNSCRRCYTLRINRGALARIIQKFKPASDYNGEIFNIFTSDYSGRYIKNSDLPAAKRFSTYLETHSVAAISSWADINSLSSEAKIRYTNHATHGCPFIRVGRVLERRGQIGARPDARIVQFKNLMNEFPKDIRPMMNEFYQDMARSQKRISSALKILNSVFTFNQTIKKPLLHADKQDAKDFIEGLSKYSSAHYTERVRSLKRFYTWTKAKEFSNDNPFANCDTAHLLRRCPECGNTRYFWTSNHLCDECYRNSLFQIKHVALVSLAKIEWAYNQHLFSLYLKYINRYRIRGEQVRTTRLLIKFLELKKLNPMRSWSDVSKTRELFMQFHQLKKVPPKGCPIEKTAYVLQELGILPVREEDHAVYVKRALERTDDAFSLIIRSYLGDLRQQRRCMRSLHGTFKMINDLYLWLKARGCQDLFSVSEELAQEYLLSRPTKDRGGVLRQVLNKFYRWAILKRKTIFNPFAKIAGLARQPSLEVCSNIAIKQIERFIKQSTSDPESALILCLIFYYGLTATDLAMATLDTHSGTLKIILHRGELSYGHNIHKRDQILTLPSEPIWLGKLQKRYLILWQKRFEKIKQNFPSSPLLLRTDSRHGRPLRSLAVRDRVKRATKLSNGFEIPTSVIRRTGAHVYAQQVGASVLTQFGWSKDYSYDFVWRQRRLFTSKQK